MKKNTHTQLKKMMQDYGQKDNTPTVKFNKGIKKKKKEYFWFRFLNQRNNFSMYEFQSKGDIKLSYFSWLSSSKDLM